MTTINGSLSERDVRIAKVQQLRDLGINPYVQKFDKNDDIASLLHKNTQNLRNIEDIITEPCARYSIAGRLTLYRSHGKLSFGRLMDESGEIQIMRHSDNCHINIGSSESFERNRKIGDILQLKEESREALRYIINLLNENKIEYELSGGLAAKVYGSNRSPADIDIDIFDYDITQFIDLAKDFFVKYEYYEDAQWRIPIVTLDYKGQIIELCDTKNAYIFDNKEQKWMTYPGTDVHVKTIEFADGAIKIISEENLILYKSRIARIVDSYDLHKIAQGHSVKEVKPDLSAYKIIEKYIDVGDFIGVRGELFMTHKGELTLFVSEYQLLSKAIRPLGDKFHGIGDDQEKAYRQRYLDMIFNRETLERMKLRSKFMKVIRDFYEEHGFMEIETPVLGSSASGAAARPFVTHHHDFDQEMYLRISPETNLKKATVGMVEKIFEVAKDFRNEGSDPSHIQEFTMIEHYAAYRNHEDNMRFTEQMFDYIFKHIPTLSKIVRVVDKNGVSKEVNFQTPRQRIDYIAQIKSDSGIDVSQYGADDEEKLRAEIKKQGHNREGLEVQTTATMIDYLYKKVTRPKIVGPAFIVNYPKTMQPLARQSDSNPNIVEQRQLLINGREVIKAYCELVDPIAQQANFDEQAQAIAQGDDEATKGDDDFVKAMEYGMPPQSGRGMGIDRILALLTEQANIRDVVLFPLMKPENPTNNTSIGSPTPEKKVVQATPTNDTVSSLHADHHFVSSATSLSEKYLTDTLLHCQQVAHLMKYFAHTLGKSDEEASYRYIVGLLHDIDRDHINKDAARHLQNDLERMIDELSIPDAEKEQIVVDIRSHGPELSGITPSTEIQKYLISIDELSGLMYAYARMRDGFVGMEVSGVIKRIKDKKFAAGVDREHVRNCEKYLGISLETFIVQMIEGFQSFA